MFICLYYIEKRARRQGGIFAIFGWKGEEQRAALLAERIKRYNNLMAQTLSNREKDVVQLLLQGNSNKLIARSLGISERTVEFHLKNIYAKYQVSSRLELILRLGNHPEGSESENLGDSTVENTRENTENRTWFNAWMDWAASFGEHISKIGEVVRMKLFVNSDSPSGAAPMTFAQSIRVCLSKYAEFSGRATRAEFWWFILFITLVAAALMYLSEVFANIFLIAMLLPLLAAGARRLTDSGKSPWWQLFLLAPVGGLVILGFLWALPTTAPTEENTPPA